MSSNKLAYQIFKIAQERYGVPPNQLDLHKHEECLRIAEYAFRMEEAVLSSSESLKVVVLEKDVRAAFSEIQQRYENDEDFEEDLERVKLNRGMLFDALLRELHYCAVLEYISSDCEAVTDTDVSLFYYMHINRFDVPEIRTARHILITVNEENKENSREESLKKINRISTRILKKPSRFEEQALKHSECPTSLQGGMLGKIKRGVLYPEIENELFELNVGKLSSIVESPLGFHLLRCDEIQEAGTLPLAQVKAGLVTHLEERNRKKKQRQWLNYLLNTTSEENILMAKGMANV